MRDERNVHIRSKKVPGFHKPNRPYFLRTLKDFFSIRFNFFLPMCSNIQMNSFSELKNVKLEKSSAAYMPYIYEYVCGNKASIILA